jgi:autotransporter-associated beta strand protein
MVNQANLTSTMNLNGGEVRLSFFNARFNAALPDTATANINFNGSSVRAKSNYADFIETNSTTTVTANVQAGGAKFDTNNFAITIKQPLIHDPALGATLDGGLTKNGLGTLTLAPVAGPNTYTGPTTVNLGTLAVSGTSIDDLGKLDIVSGKVLIPAATNETVKTLFFNGVQQAAGVYGSSASGVPLAFQNDTFFDVAGTGTLTVTSGPSGSSFASWAAAFSSPALSPSGATADADFDGLANSVEYVIGGDPRVSSQAGRPTSATNAGVITFSFNREDSSETPDVTTIVQVSNDLVDWTTQPSFTVGATTATSTAGVVVDENAGAPDTITVTIPNTSAAKKFARLSVVITP